MVRFEFRMVGRSAPRHAQVEERRMKRRERNMDDGW